MISLEARVNTAAGANVIRIQSDDYTYENLTPEMKRLIYLSERDPDSLNGIQVKHSGVDLARIISEYDGKPELPEPVKPIITTQTSEPVLPSTSLSKGESAKTKQSESHPWKKEATIVPSAKNEDNLGKRLKSLERQSSGIEALKTHRDDDDDNPAPTYKKKDHSSNTSNTDYDLRRKTKKKKDLLDDPEESINVLDEKRRKRSAGKKDGETQGIIVDRQPRGTWIVTGDFGSAPTEKQRQLREEYDANQILKNPGKLPNRKTHEPAVTEKPKTTQPITEEEPVITVTRFKDIDSLLDTLGGKEDMDFKKFQEELRTKIKEAYKKKGYHEDIYFPEQLKEVMDYEALIDVLAEARFSKDSIDATIFQDEEVDFEEKYREIMKACIGAGCYSVEMRKGKRYNSSGKTVCFGEDVYAILTSAGNPKNIGERADIIKLFGYLGQKRRDKFLSQNRSVRKPKARAQNKTSLPDIFSNGIERGYSVNLSSQEEIQSALKIPDFVFNQLYKSELVIDENGQYRLHSHLSDKSDDKLFMYDALHKVDDKDNLEVIATQMEVCLSLAPDGFGYAKDIGLAKPFYMIPRDKSAAFSSLCSGLLLDDFIGYSSAWYGICETINDFATIPFLRTLFNIDASCSQLEYSLKEQAKFKISKRTFAETEYYVPHAIRALLDSDIEIPALGIYNELIDHINKTI